MKKPVAVTIIRCIPISKMHKYHFTAVIVQIVVHKLQRDADNLHGCHSYHKSSLLPLFYLQGTLSTQSSKLQFPPCFIEVLHTSILILENFLSQRGGGTKEKKIVRGLGQCMKCMENMEARQAFYRQRWWMFCRPQQQSS